MISKLSPLVKSLLDRGVHLRFLGVSLILLAVNSAKEHVSVVFLHSITPLHVDLVIDGTVVVTEVFKYLFVSHDS